MAPYSNTVLLAAAGTAALALAARSALSSKSSSSSSSTSLPTSSPSQKELNPEDCIQPEDVIDIFDALFLHMQTVLAQLSAQLQQIQMAGQVLPEAKVRELLKGEFERALLAKQKVVFEKHDVDEECLQQAVWEFMDMADEEENGGGDEKYVKAKRAVERFQKLYENISGESVVGRRPGDGKGSTSTSTSTAIVETMSKEKLLKAASVYFDALTNAMGSTVKQFQEDGKDLKDRTVVQQLHMRFASVANDAGEAALEQMGVTLSSFKSSIEKHSADPQVGQALAMLQMKQQQQMMAMGIPSM